MLQAILPCPPSRQRRPQSDSIQPAASPCPLSRKGAARHGNAAEPRRQLLGQNALAELSALLWRDLYQDELNPDSRLAQSKAYVNNALLKAVGASNHDNCQNRLSLWEAVNVDLLEAEMAVLRDQHEHFQSIQEADPLGWSLRGLEVQIAAAQDVTAAVYTYWRGWNEALGYGSANPEAPSWNQPPEAPAPGQEKVNQTLLLPQPPKAALLEHKQDR